MYSLVATSYIDPAPPQRALAARHGVAAPGADARGPAQVDLLRRGREEGLWERVRAQMATLTVSQDPRCASPPPPCASSGPHAELARRGRGSGAAAPASARTGGAPPSGRGARDVGPGSAAGGPSSPPAYSRQSSALSHASLSSAASLLSPQHPGTSPLPHLSPLTPGSNLVSVAWHRRRQAAERALHGASPDRDRYLPS